MSPLSRLGASARSANDSLSETRRLWPPAWQMMKCLESATDHRAQRPQSDHWANMFKSQVQVQSQCCWWKSDLFWPPPKKLKAKERQLGLFPSVNDEDLLPLFTIPLHVELAESPKRHRVSDRRQGFRAINASNRSGLGGFNWNHFWLGTNDDEATERIP